MTSTLVQVCSAKYRELRCEIRSDSDPKRRYSVTFGSRDLRIRCDCKGFQYRGECKHIGKFPVVERSCGWRSDRSAMPQQADGVCPLCGESTTLEPAWSMDDGHEREHSEKNT